MGEKEKMKFIGVYDYTVILTYMSLVSGLFSMIMVVDMSSEHTNFDLVNQDLHTLGEELGLQIRIQRNEIFDAMHHI